MASLNSTLKKYTKPFLLGFENSESSSSFLFSSIVVKWHRRIVWTFSQRHTISCPYGWHTDIILLLLPHLKPFSVFLSIWKIYLINLYYFYFSDIVITTTCDCWQENVVHVTDVPIDTTRRRLRWKCVSVALDQAKH